MAVRGWGGSIATAFGVAAGAGAAQLGFGYGLGIVSWAPSNTGADPATWVASLAWATWIAATSTIAGAVCAQRLHDRSGPTPAARSGTRRLALALAAALGALITVALVAVPARTATPVDTGSPQTVAATYAAVGVLVGLLVAVWALHSPPAAGNVIATVGWLWLLAVLAVGDSVLAGRGLTSAQLGIWQITAADDGRFWFRDHFYWPGALLALASALLIGALAARRAARLAYRRVGAAASGGAGPLLVAVAYFVAAPRLDTIRAEQLSAHLVAPYAVVVGLAGSLLVAALAQRAAAAAAARPAADAATGSTDVADWIDASRPSAAAGQIREPGGRSGPARLPRQRTGEPVPADPITAEAVTSTWAGEPAATGSTDSRTREEPDQVADAPGPTDGAPADPATGPPAGPTPRAGRRSRS